MANYRIGELDQEVEIYRPTKTQDGKGGFISSDVLLYTLDCFVMEKGGGEVFKYEKVEATANYRFVIRNNEDLGILETDIIKWDGDQYNIRAIPKKGSRKLYLEIDAERGVAQ